MKRLSAARQLAQELRLSIQQGKWMPGAQLPTVRQLAGDYEVSLNTVHMALKQLAADDLIECKPRLGGFVRAASHWADHVSASAPRQVAVIRPISPGEDPRVDETQQTGEIIHGIEMELAKQDLHPVLISFELEDPEAVGKLLRQIDRLRSQLTGVIVFAVGAIRQELFDQLDARDLTWVTVNRLDHLTLDNFSTTDNTQCGEIIGQCLACADVRRALVLGQRTQSDVERIAGIIKGYWSKTTRLLGIEFLHMPDWREGPAYDTTLEYLSQAAALPQAVVGLGDIIAVGAMRALQSRGIRVPEDVGVLSTTGLAIASYSSPPLTAYHVSLDEAGRGAAQLLLEMLAGGLKRLKGRFASGKMVFRQSFALPEEIQSEILASIPSPAARDARPFPSLVQDLTSTRQH